MIKLISLFIFCIMAFEFAQADVMTQENLKTHLRWNLIVPRDQVYIVKRDQTLFIETVNLELFETLAKDLSGISPNGQYIEKVSASKDNFPVKPATISVKLKDRAVELFSFYRDADKKYILDFWINSDLMPEKPVVLSKPLPLAVESRPVTKVVKKKSAVPEVLLVKKSDVLPVIDVTPKDTEEKKINPDYRDYRYGASFIWDYQAMIPT